MMTSISAIPAGNIPPDWKTSRSPPGWSASSSLMVMVVEHVVTNIKEGPVVELRNSSNININSFENKDYVHTFMKVKGQHSLNITGVNIRADFQQLIETGTEVKNDLIDIRVDG